MKIKTVPKSAWRRPYRDMDAGQIVEAFHKEMEEESEQQDKS